MSQHTIVSIRPFEGHFGEWLCHLPNPYVMDTNPKTKTARDAEHALSMLPSTSPLTKPSGLAYMVCLAPDHPLATPIATEEWPRRPGRLSPLNNYTPGVLLLERLYELPKDPVWYGIEYTYTGATAVPASIMISEVKEFATQVLMSKNATQKALQQALHP